MAPGLRALLGEGVKKTIIFEAELLAVVCAMKLWQKHITGAPVVLHIDNSARDVAISGSGRAEVPKTHFRVKSNSYAGSSRARWSPGISARHRHPISQIYHRSAASGSSLGGL